MSERDGVELKWIIDVIKRRLWLVILLPVLAVAGAILYTKVETPVYESTVVLYIQPNPSAGTNEDNLLQAGERLTFTYSEVLKSQPVLQMVISQLGLDTTPTKLADQIVVTAIPNTQLIRFTVSQPTAKGAASVAGALAKAFISQVQNLQTDRFYPNCKPMNGRCSRRKMHCSWRYHNCLIR
jgi:capsular polysaccharide biosynthesis protein